MAEELEQIQEENIQPTQAQDVQMEQVEQVDETKEPTQEPPSKASQLYSQLLKEGYTEKNLYGGEQNFINKVSTKEGASKLFAQLKGEGYSDKNLYGGLDNFINTLVSQPPVQKKIKVSPNAGNSIREYEKNQNVYKLANDDYNKTKNKNTDSNIFEEFGTEAIELINPSRKYQRQQEIANSGQSLSMAEQNATSAQNKLKPELESIVSYVEDNVEKYIDKTIDGLPTPNVNKINSFAKSIAKQFNVREGGYFSTLVYNQAKGAVANKIIQPQVDSKFKELYKKETGKNLDEDLNADIQKKFTKGAEIKNQLTQSANVVSNEIQENVKAQVSSLQYNFNEKAKTINDDILNTKNQIDATFSNFIKDGKFVGTEEQYAQYQNAYGELEKKAEAAKPILEGLNKDFIEQQNIIRTKANARYRRQLDEISRIAEDKYGKEFEKFSKEFQRDPKLKQRVERLYKQAYVDVVSGNEHLKKITNDIQGNPMLSMTKDFLSALGGSISSFSSQNNFRAGEVFGDYLEGKFDIGTEEIKSLADFADPQKLLKSFGQLGGGMAIPIIGTAASVALARGAGAGKFTQAVIGAAMEWVSDTAAQAGAMKRDIFAETGDIAKAENAAIETIKGQKLNMPFYAFSGLPFMDNITTFGKNKLTRALIGGAIEYGTELPVEYLQNLQEEAIKESGDYRNMLKYHSLEKFKNTSLQIGTVFALGAVGQLKSEGDEAAEIQNAAKSFALKYKFNELAPTQKKQFLFDMIQRQGLPFSSAYLLASYTSGNIDKATFEDMGKTIASSQNLINKSKDLGLTPADQKIFSAFSFEYENIKKKYDEEQDPIIKQALATKMMDYQSQLENFTNNKKADYSVVTYPNNEQYVFTINQINNALDNPDFAKALRSGDIKVDAFGENNEIKNKIYDTQNGKRIPSPVRTRQAIIQTQPIEGGGTQEIGGGGVLQEDVTSREGEVGKEAQGEIEAQKADIERRRQEELYNIITEESTEENRRPNGSIGTQGFDPTQMKDLIKFLNEKLKLNIDKKLFEGEKLKPLIDFIKDDKDLVEKIKQYVKTDPIEISRMPDGSLSFRDGNHRANLLNLIGSDILPTIEVGQRNKIDEINDKYDAELKALEEKQKESEQVQPTGEEVSGAIQPTPGVPQGQKVEAGVQPSAEPVSGRGAEAAATVLTPKEGDTVELPSQVKGGIPRTMVFNEGEWKQQVGGKPVGVGENVRQQAQTAFQKTTPVAEAPVPKTKTEQVGEGLLSYLGIPTEPKKPSGKKAVNISNKSELAELENKTQGEKKTIVQAAKKAIATLKSVFPDMEIYIHEDADSYNETMREEVGGVQNSRGNFAFERDASGNPTGVGRIDINLSNAKDTTVAHEITHAVLLKAFGDNPALFKTFRDRMSKILREDLNEEVTAFENLYKGKEVAPEEYLTELSALLSRSGETVEYKPSTLRKIAALINEYVSKITGGKFQPFKSEADFKNFVDFLNQVAGAIREGDEINLNVKDSGDTVISGVLPLDKIKSKSDLGFKKHDVKWEISADSGIVLNVPKDKKSMYDVVEKSGGAVVVINSDATGIGLTKDKDLLQGGIGYTFIDANVKDNIGFAASNDVKIASFYKAVVDAANKRDAEFPEMKGKPVAIFVMVQTPTAMFGNTYAAEYFGRVLSKITTSKLFNTKEAKKELIEFIEDYKANNKTGKKYSNSLDKLSSLIKTTDFSKKKSIDKLVDLLITNRVSKEDKSAKFGFDIRRSFFEKFFVGVGTVKQGAPARNLRLKLKEKGYNHQDFIEEFGDKNVVSLLEGDTPGRKQADGNFTLTGFFVDPYQSKSDFVENSKKGTYKHKQFNSKFYGVNPFVLDGKYYVDKMFPEARFLTEKGEEIPVQVAAAGSLYPRTQKSAQAIVERAKGLQTISKSQIPAFNEGVDYVKNNAEEYKKSIKKDDRTNIAVPSLYTNVSKMISDAYDKLKNDPNKTDVKIAYDAMMRETIQQYDFIVSKGLNIIKHLGKGEPYANSKEMLKDLKDNKTLKFLPNEFAFGQTLSKIEDNIGLQPSGRKLKDGYELTNSEVFRVVHDYFGHGILGNQFGAIGEENATLQHLDLFSDIAAPAVIFQTRGQNSWVNFSGENTKAIQLRKDANELKKQGKIEEANKLFAEAEKLFKFAEPKINIFPNEFNFKRYESARRINDQEAINGISDKRVDDLPKLLEEYSAKSRRTRGVNKRNIRGIKRLGKFNVNVISEYTFDNKINEGILKAFPNFKGVQKIYEITDGDAYHKMMVKALETNKFASSVTVHTPEEFSKMRMFVTEDGSTGITLTKEGFLGGAFSDKEANRPQNLAQLMVLGVKEGATTAEAFHTILPNYYSNFGFKAVSKTEFNDKYRPLIKNGNAVKDWDYKTYEKFNNGRPDVVFFIYDGGDRNIIEDKLGLFDDYDSYDINNTKSFNKEEYDNAENLMKQSAIKRLELDFKNEKTFVAESELPTTITSKSQKPQIKDYIESQRKAGVSDEDIRAGIESVADKVGLTKEDIDTLMAGEVKAEVPVQENPFEKVPKTQAARTKYFESTFGENAERAEEIYNKYKDTNDFDSMQKEMQGEKVKVTPAIETVGITKKDIKELAAKYNIEIDERREAISDIEIERMARELIANGYDVNNLVKEALDTEKRPLTDIEANILAEVAADMKAKIDVNSSNADIQKYRDVLSALNKGISENARGLRMAKVRKNVVESIADVMSNMMEDNLVDELTTEQRKEAEKRFNEIKEALDKETELRKQAEAEIDKLKAELKVEQEKNKSKDKPKKAPQEFKVEKESIIKSIKDKWQSIISGTKPSKMKSKSQASGQKLDQLMAIAPEIKKLIKGYIENGIATTLDDVKAQLKKDIEDAGITLADEDLNELVAGNYNKKKKDSKRELNRKLYELKQEQKLLLEIEKLEAGEVPTTEKKKIQKNQKLTELRKKIKQLTGKELPKKEKKEKTEDEKFAQALNTRIKANEKRQAEIQEKIDNEDFEPEEKKESILENTELQKRNRALYDKYLDSVLNKDEKLLEYEKKRVADKMKNRGKLEKIAGGLDVALTTAKGTVAMFDQSVYLVQMLPFTLSHPYEAAKYAVQSLKYFADKTAFDKTMATLHSTELWNLIEKSGLVIYEPRSPKADLRNELHGGDKNLWNKEVEFRGKKYSIGQAFERSTTSALNNARIYLFMNQVQNLYNAGKTFENSPKDFEAAARAVNELTGHGKLAAPAQMISKFLGSFIWSAKMFASTLNLAGLGDLVRPVATANAIARKFGIKTKESEKYTNKGFYTSLTPEQGKFVAKEMSRFIGTGIMIMVAAKLASMMRGDDDDEVQIDIDPRSSGFGSIKSGDKTFVIYGRFGSAVRTIVQALSGTKVVKGEEQELGQGYGSKTSGDVVFGSFVRGKATPAAGLAYDFFLNNRKNYYTKEELTPKTIGKQMLVPMAAQDMAKDFDRDGFLLGTAETVAKIYGAGIRDDRDFMKKEEEVFTEEDMTKNAMQMLKEYSVEVPKFGTIEKNKIEVDKNHPEAGQYKNGTPYALFTPEEFEKYNKYRKDYIIKGLKVLYRLNKSGDIKLTKQKLEERLTSLKSQASKIAKMKIPSLVEKNKEKADEDITIDEEFKELFSEENPNQ